MKVLLFVLLFLLSLICSGLYAQSDSSILRKPTHQRPTRADTLSLARLNHSSNMMIAGGVGFCGVGAFLLYYGVTVYSTGPDATSTTPAEKSADVSRNHTQGAVLLAAGSLSIAGGITLITFGAMRKYDFKVRKKALSLQAGLLPNGRMQVALNF